MKSKIPDGIAVWAFKSIAGEVTQNMRMISFAYGGNKAKYRFYVFDRPSEEEKEIAAVVAVNFDSGISSSLESLDVEFVISKEPLGKLDTLDLTLFRRWEPV